MINALYSACWTDPWLTVAEKLKQDNIIKPVCWVGYEADNSEKSVLEAFPSIYYQRYFDAWKGKFPTDIEHKIDENISDYLLDVDFIKKMGPYEIQALQMMNRMDYDGYSFSFMERQRHFRLLLRKWSFLLDYLKIDLVISATVPHRVYDYAIYFLCKQKSIPFFAFRETAFTGRIIPVDNIYSISNKLGQVSSIRELNKKTLPEDIQLNLNKLSIDYSAAEPLYMKKHVSSDRKEQNIYGNVEKVISKKMISNKKLLGKDGVLLSGFPTYHKLKNRNIEDSYTPFLTHIIRKIKAVNYKNRLRSYYQKNTSKVNYNKKYAFFAMHYQPEMTSNPAGDIFADQMLCIDTLLKYLPKDYYLYVKEHKSQFYSHTAGHTARMKSFYDDVLKYDRVSFVPLEEDVFKLIENATVVSTVTGTVGWEAMAKGKPVITFGMSWYENFEGVLKIKCSEDAIRIPEFIMQYRYNEGKLLEYLHSLNENSIVAYYLRGIKEKINLKEEDCVNNICSQIKLFIK